MNLETISPLIKERHALDMRDFVYKEAFLSEQTENPYTFPLELNLKMIEASSSKPFTEEKKQDLISSRDEFDQTFWSRWSRGHFARTQLSHILKS